MKDELLSLAEKVRSRITMGDGCWEWPGAKWPKGYGQVWSGAHRRIFSCHRVMYEEANGPIPEGMQIDHLCRNPSCCNPAHLEAVTPRENTRRGNAGLHVQIERAALTHCPRGHEYNAENIYTSKRGKRHCKICAIARGSERRARLREARVERTS